MTDHRIVSVTDHHIVSGDTSPLRWSVGADLSQAADVTLLLADNAGTLLTEDLLDVIDAPTGVVEWTPAEADVTTRVPVDVVRQVRVRVDWADGTTSTHPATGAGRLRIAPPWAPPVAL